MSRPSSQAGFTLIETLMVVAIVAVVTLSAAYALNLKREPSLELLARELAGALALARMEAIVSGEERTVMVDVSGRRYWVSDPVKTATLPISVSLRLVVADAERRDTSIGGIRFFPDGAATGGEVHLSRLDDTAAVKVDWLTGRARILEPAR